MKTSSVVANLRRNFGLLKSARATWAIVVVLIVFHAWIGIHGGLEHPEIIKLFERFGLTAVGILEGRLYQLFSYAFLHGDWSHVILNSLLLLGIGSRIEHMVGRRAFLMIISGGVLAGAVAHLMLTPYIAAPILVGMSGGGMALLLFLTTLSPQSRMMPLPLSGRSLGLGILISSLLMSICNPALELGWFASIGDWIVAAGMETWFGVGHACHFGGALAGLLFAKWILRTPVTLKRLRRDRAQREANEFESINNDQR